MKKDHNDEYLTRYVKKNKENIKTQAHFGIGEK